MIGQGDVNTYLTEAQVRELCARALDRMDLAGKKVIVLIPDHTRTAPIGMMFRVLYDLIGEQVERLDYLIALGTHHALSEEKILRRLELTAAELAGKYAKVRVFNHRWEQPDTFRRLGTITADEIEAISGGLMREDVPVAVNKMIFDYDEVFIVCPVFPHEVIGFSGGNKYFFPGISSREIINFTHWLGAVITNVKINGTKDTPVRAVVDRAAAMIDRPKTCLAMVVTQRGLHGLYIDRPEAAWSAAADLSAQVHVVYKDRPFHQVLGLAPEMYEDIWLAGKVMYKLEPVVAEGGELVIYAPHIREISHSHGPILDRIGYHVRDYFLKQMDRFADIPRGVMAHSTHVKGVGLFEDGIECPRVNVVLATGIPEARCRRINLGYRDPATIDLAEYENREDEGILLVRNAGEVLHRLK